MSKNNTYIRQLNVIMFLYGYFHTDTRVKREAYFLAKQGNKIKVLNLYNPELDYRKGKRVFFKKITDFKIMSVRPCKRPKVTYLMAFWVISLLHALKSSTKVDVIHCHDLTGLPPGVIYKIFHPRVKLIYDSHELFPEAARDKLNSFFGACFLILEVICGYFVNSVIGASKIQLSILRKRIKNKPFFLLMNVPDLENIQTEILLQAEQRHNGTDDKQAIEKVFNIGYSGTILPYRGYDKFVEAAYLVLQKDRNFNFWIIGNGSYLEIVKKLVAKYNIEDNFFFTGHLPYEDLLSSLLDIDIGICLYETMVGNKYLFNNNVMISNKIFEYMMTGTPFIYSDLLASLPLIKSVDAVAVDPGNPAEIAKAIILLSKNSNRRHNISKKGVTLVKSKYNWNNEAKKLLKAYYG